EERYAKLFLPARIARAPAGGLWGETKGPILGPVPAGRDLAMGAVGSAANERGLSCPVLRRRHVRELAGATGLAQHHQRYFAQPLSSGGRLSRLRHRRGTERPQSAPGYSRRRNDSHRWRVPPIGLSSRGS